MRGFTRRAEVGDVWQWIDRSAQPLAAEPVAVDDASGRVLAADVVAAVDVPAFERSAMDGYAVRGEETVGASDYNPLAFRVIGRALPGQPYAGTVQTGDAVRIMTGAPLPAGADAVIPAEYVRDTAEGIETSMAFGPGKHVGRVGEDIARGAVVLRAGRRLRPQDAGVLGSLGIGAVTVHRAPRVRIVVTGNEVVAPGRDKGLHDIFDANSAMLRGLVARDGGALERHLRTGDDPMAIRDAITAPGADVVLVSGGSSVGTEDHAPRLVAEAGELAIHGVAMRPSSPAGCGRVGDALVFLLPGNPVSCLAAYDFFAGRAVRLLGGRAPAWPYPQRRLHVARKIVSAIGRVDYCRVRIRAGEVEPLALSGASVLSSTTRADGFVVVPAESEGIAPGADVDVFLYDPT
ncbi:molybdopterin molybdotransferase MoeA [Schlegelella sp. ID0723]|uniref:Molybdopterin molybdenumtransferase n=2 Tax=Piscinibacter koreensis TaxID=2742824 RepID=A0A7Y6NS74_9BURK|nr:molybdopterin molybdotransferase MoeA [Schlegelella koreensis]